VNLAASLHGLERAAQELGQVISRVAGDGETGADFGPVEGKSPQDHGAARPEHSLQPSEIRSPIRLADEEVEDGAVVPEVVVTIGLPVEEVLVEERDGRIAESPPHLLEHGR
jgi:hypothetical protein